jgi:hypothetical protein
MIYTRMQNRRLCGKLKLMIFAGGEEYVQAGEFQILPGRIISKVILLTQSAYHLPKEGSC